MFKKLCLSVFLFAGLLLIGAPNGAQAAEPRLMETHGNWLVYSFVEDGNKVCYMASKPTKAEGKYSRRGEIFALVTNRPAEKTKNVFSYIAGYDYKAGSDVSVEIDGQRFILFTQDSTAWAPDAQTDNRLADAMRKGSKMVVKGTSKRGTVTKDTFSLKGSSAAHGKVNAECR